MLPDFRNQILTLVISLMVQSVLSHTWIDCLGLDGDKLFKNSDHYVYGGDDTFDTCEGYAINYPGRHNKDVGTLYTHKMLKTQVEEGTDVCADDKSVSYPVAKKVIQVKPGQPVYYAYLPNGHIVKDQKAKGTTYGVYWTKTTGSKLTSTKEIKSENLIPGSFGQFDDGHCGESLDSKGKPSHRAGDGKPCIGKFKVPEGTSPGTYHAVWYWTFYLKDEKDYVDPNAARGYAGAAYSTCFKFTVTDGSGSAFESHAEAKLPSPVEAPAAVVPAELKRYIRAAEFAINQKEAAKKSVTFANASSKVTTATLDTSKHQEKKEDSSVPQPRTINFNSLDSDASSTSMEVPSVKAQAPSDATMEKSKEENMESDTIDDSASEKETFNEPQSIEEKAFKSATSAPSEAIEAMSVPIGSQCPS